MRRKLIIRVINYQWINSHRLIIQKKKKIGIIEKAVSIWKNDHISNKVVINENLEIHQYHSRFMKESENDDVN
jgi:hypothetical protein